MKESSLFIWPAQGNESYGVVSAMLNLAGEVRSNGHRVKFVLFEKGEFYELIRQNGHECDLVEVGSKLSITRRGLLASIRSVLRNACKMVKTCVCLRRYLKQKRPDFFHIVPNVLVLPGAVAARFSGVRVIFEMSNALSDAYPLDLNRRLYRGACRMSNCLVLANSAYSGTTIRGAAVAPITFHLGVDGNKFKLDGRRAVTRESLGLRSEHFVVGLIARFSVEKGQLTLVQALRVASEARPELRVLLVGGAGSQSYLDEVKDYVATHHLGGLVVFAGSQKCVEDYYALVDITVNLRPDPEPFGLSVVESMLMEKPVLVHALGGPAETVLAGRTGWHMNSVEVSEVAENLIAIASQPECLEQMGADARDHAESKFSLESQYRRYVSAINNHYGDD